MAKLDKEFFESKLADGRILLVNESTKVKTMKQALKIILAGTLLFTFATAPLRAQTNAAAENASNAPTTNSELARGHAKANSFPNSLPPLLTLNRDGFSITPDVNLTNEAWTAGVVGCVLMAVFIFGSRHKAMVRSHRDVQETLRAMIEKGIPLTPELMESIRGKQFPPAPTPSRPRALPGLILTVIGMGLVDGGHSFGGWIVVFIGIAFLVVWLIQSCKPNDQSSQNSNPASQPPKQ